MIALSFLLTQKLRWSGLDYLEKGVGADWVPPTERGRELARRYLLLRWRDRVGAETLNESLGTLDLLDRIPREIVFRKNPEHCDARDLPLSVLDIGARNWRYAGALAAWFHPYSVTVTGIELDAFRLYSNLRTRLSFGRYFAEVYSSGTCAKFHFQAGDAGDWNGQADVVTWFFPFVLPSPHRAWGLPFSRFDPKSLFKHVESRCLRPGGVLIMANQGEWEWTVAKGLFTGLKLLDQREVVGSLHATIHPIFLSVWTREA